jgi:hypothetical protein
MTCALKGCDHEAQIEMRASRERVGKWRAYCGCCTDLMMIFWALSGATIQMRDINANVVSHADVEAAHAALAKYEGNFTDLLR